jgi:hypothetical protein
MRRTKYPGVHWLSGKRYRVRFVARDPKTGREKEIKKVIEAASDSAAMEVRLRLMRAAASESQRAERMRLSDYAESWLRTKLPELKASTADKYATMLDLHILPGLGDYFIDATAPADMLQWRDRQAKLGVVSTCECESVDVGGSPVARRATRPRYLRAMMNAIEGGAS